MSREHPPTPVQRISLHTLGCKLNYSETASIARQFSDRGFVTVPFGDDSEVVLINTCSVTENAEKECRQLVRRIQRKYPSAFVVVTGCYAQLRPEEIASIEGVDLVLGAKEKFQIFEHVQSFHKQEVTMVFASDIAEALAFQSAVSSESDERTRAFLKVQDGCDYSCSFCTIPRARGASRSAEIEDVLDRAARLCAEGFHEIILSGVNVGDFGRQTGDSFLELAQAIERDERITARLRVSSIEPNLLKEQLIDLVAGSSKFVPHFHLPLQSGSPKILRLMQRRYNRELYVRRVEQIRALMPHAAIGADVIVGFPSEEDEDFEDTYKFLQEINVSYLHVFSYSERPDTLASRMPGRVPADARSERSARLRILSEKKKHAFFASQTGREAVVVLERGRRFSGTENAFDGKEGFTENYVRVKLTGPVPDAAEVVRVRIGEVTGEVAKAEPLEIIASRRSPVLLPILQ